MGKECNVCVDAGVCRMVTRIHAEQQDDMMVKVDIESDCHNVLRMSWGLKPINPYSEIESPVCESEIYRLANDTLPHAACPVPCAIIKAVEVASDMGIRRDVTITIE